MTTPAIESRGLTKYYGTTLALDHLDCTIPSGCICAMVGRNGSGKTTAIKLFLGLLSPTSGSSSVLGCDSRKLTPKLRKRIGYAAEGHKLFRWMSIGALEKFQQPFFPGTWNGGAFDEMLDYFGLSKKQKIKQLSNGQRAQVSLALTLAPDPELLILDDPTLGLDAAIRRQFLEGMIKLIMRRGRTVLFSSHILSDVERVSDRILVLDRGVIRADCTLDTFRSAVKKVILPAGGPPPQEIDIPGLLHVKQTDSTVEVIVVTRDDEAIPRWAESRNVDDYHIEHMNLEDQFIEYTASGGTKKHFTWEGTSK